MQLKEVTRTKFNRRTSNYDSVPVFAGYNVGEINKSGSWTTIKIHGPKKVFTLCNCAKPLVKISPPIHDGENARQEKFPLFFVLDAKKIQGIAYFALINDILVPYKSCGSNIVEEL